MTDSEQRDIFSKNLNYLLEKHKKTQREVADSIQVSPQTFNTWCQAIALPRMGKVQRLADYFHVPKSALIDPPSSDNSVPRILTADQEKLLFLFNQLNAVGRAAALERIEEMTQNKKFTAPSSTEKMA